MTQPLRYENENEIFFITTRTLGSRLWFINNPELNYKVIAYLAKYQKVYNVKIHAFVFMGNHYHLIARFPDRNKSAFMRSFNSIVAKLTSSIARNFDGKVWARRYSDQVIKGDDAVEHYFFYAALNPILAGITQQSEDFENYNSFTFSLRSTPKSYKLFNRTAYYNAKRWSNDVRHSDYVEKFQLILERLPGYEDYSSEEYINLLKDKFHERKSIVIKERRDAGRGFMTKKLRLKATPGSIPRSTKTSSRYSFRPLVLTLCKEMKQQFLNFYFCLLQSYKESSIQFRKGYINVIFPPGTYKPPSIVT